jgi:hypothetical protein
MVEHSLSSAFVKATEGSHAAKRRLSPSPIVQQGGFPKVRKRFLQRIWAFNFPTMFDVARHL